MRLQDVDGNPAALGTTVRLVGSGPDQVAIGTEPGASAIQVVPEIVDQVEKLVLFQRTPPWVIPRDDRPFHALEKAAFRSPLGPPIGSRPR